MLREPQHVIVMDLHKPWPLMRQSSDGQGAWGSFKFDFNDGSREADALVVLEGLHEECKVQVPQGRAVFVAMEFPAIKPSYHPDFIAQFDAVITYPGRRLRGKKTFLRPGLFPWFYGVKYRDGRPSPDGATTYSELKALNSATAENKIPEISAVISSKRLTPDHAQRLKFVDELQRHFGEHFHLFGRDGRSISDKSEAIAPYCYHLSIENSSVRGGMSEKLYDAFLGDAYPFYYGAPDALDYFSDRSMTMIDIYDIERSISLIEHCIETDVFSGSASARAESRRRVLDDYQFFPVTAEILQSELKSTSKPRTRVFLPESHFISNPSLRYRLSTGIKRRTQSILRRIDL